MNIHDYIDAAIADGCVGPEEVARAAAHRIPKRLTREALTHLLMQPARERLRQQRIIPDIDQGQGNLDAQVGDALVEQTPTGGQSSRDALAGSVPGGPNVNRRYGRQEDRYEAILDGQFDCGDAGWKRLRDMSRDDCLYAARDVCGHCSIHDPRAQGFGDLHWVNWWPDHAVLVE